MPKITWPHVKQISVLHALTENSQDIFKGRYLGCPSTWSIYRDLLGSKPKMVCFCSVLFSVEAPHTENLNFQYVQTEPQQPLLH